MQKWKNHEMPSRIRIVFLCPLEDFLYLKKSSVLWQVMFVARERAGSPRYFFFSRSQIFPQLIATTKLILLYRTYVHWLWCECLWALYIPVNLTKLNRVLKKVLPSLKDFLRLLILLVDCHCHSRVTMADRVILDIILLQKQWPWFGSGSSFSIAC